MLKNFYAKLIISLFIFDQVTKFFAEKYLTYYKSISIFAGLSLIKVHNFGAAYGIFQNKQVLITAISFTLLLLGWLFRYQLANGKMGLIGLAIIASGAFGNLSDRIFRGYVVDMFDIHIIPVFNIADVLINIGIIILLCETFFTAKKTHEPT